MSLALRLYEQLTETTDERVRLSLIADAIGELEESWPRAGEIARSSDVRESELRLQREVEVVRKEIEVVRRETKEVELNLQKEIKDAELPMRKAMHRQTLWVIGAVGTVVGLVRLLDWLLA
jgi:hypothetical protein